MSKLTPVDLAFLLLENPSRPTHMAGFQVFRLPARGSKTFISRLLAAYRDSEIGKPFNQKLKWLGKGAASWETVDPDPRFHIRHLAVPAPGSMEDFYNIVSFLNSSLLDRNRPLWECYVIEGLEGDQFAIFTKVHHALIDGMGAMKLDRRALSSSPRDRAMRPVWAPGEEPTRRKQSRSDKSQLQKLPVAVRQLYALLLSGTGTLPELSTAFEAIPNYNLIISNMAGPREQLYLAGAPMMVSGGLPIVPPGCGLNVTFGSVNQTISLAVGAAPEAVEEPGLIAKYITQAFTKLEKATAA
jgi:WS/DGAT/MGAT family acyltransferase